MGWEEKLLKSIERTAGSSVDVKEFEIGRVVSADPLQIVNGDLPLFSSNLYINSDLMANTRNFTSLTGTVGGSTTTITNGSIDFKQQLAKDDLVLMRKMSETMYVVLFKMNKGA
ncbi:MAG: DUF2577 family protein [Solirubrobacterales bacterium]